MQLLLKFNTLVSLPYPAKTKRTAKTAYRLASMARLLRASLTMSNSALPGPEDYDDSDCEPWPDDFAEQQFREHTEREARQENFEKHGIQLGLMALIEARIARASAPPPPNASADWRPEPPVHPIMVDLAVQRRRELTDEIEHRLRIETPLANETRKRNETLLRGPKGGPRPHPNQSAAAREFKRLTDEGMSDTDAVRRLDPKHFGKPRILDPKKASKRAETYKRWVREL
jgi:hypothetical protein